MPANPYRRLAAILLSSGLAVAALIAGLVAWRVNTGEAMLALRGRYVEWRGLGTRLAYARFDERSGVLRIGFVATAADDHPNEIRIPVPPDAHEAVPGVVDGILGSAGADGCPPGPATGAAPGGPPRTAQS